MLRKQYSLKSLVLAIAVVAALLALPRERSLRQQFALRRMGAQIDGGVGFTSQNMPSRLFFGNRNGDGADALRFDGVSLSQTDAAQLALFPRLDKIRFYKCPDPKASISALAAHPHLTWLTINDSPLSDLNAIAWFENLRVLDLAGTKISDDSLAAISELYYLFSLELKNTQISGTGLADLTNLPRLEHLDLRGCPIEDSGVECLKNFPALRYLQLEGTKVSREGVERLKIDLPRCQIESDYGERKMGAGEGKGKP
jgi:hypothetical protein